MIRHADVTVIMPNYNHAHFLNESLGAIFCQSSIPKEVIVIDDASSDNSLEVIQEYQKQYPEIILIKNSKNQGPVVSLNLALRMAKGKYLGFCAADDQVLPGFFEEGAKQLDLHPKAGICCSDPSFFKNQKPYRFFRMKISKQKQPLEIKPDELEKLFLFTPLWIPSHASLFRKEFVVLSGGFPEELRHISDWYLNLKIAISHGIVHVPMSFGAFRLSTQSYGAKLGRSIRKKWKIYTELFRILSLESDRFRTVFRRAGVLGHVSSDVLIYLFMHFSLWNFIPFALFRKVCNFYRKIKRKIVFD